MNEKLRAAQGMVFPIADALRMNLMLNVKKYQTGDEMSIKGDQKIKLPVSPGVEFTADCEIKASNVTANVSWVLMKVAGFLWVMLAYLKEEDSLYFWLIDAQKIKDSDRPKTGGMYQNGKSIQFLTERLMPGVVRIYKKKRDVAEWALLSEGETTPTGEVAKPEAPDAIGISGPLSPGEARDLSVDCACTPEEMKQCQIADETYAEDWCKLAKVAQGLRNKTTEPEGDAPLPDGCAVEGCILDAGHGDRHYMSGKGFFDAPVAVQGDEIDTGEICPQCDKPKMYAAPQCDVNCHYNKEVTAEPIQKLTVIVKLKPGVKVPDYIDVRSAFGQIITAEVDESNFVKLSEDEGVLSVQVSGAKAQPKADDKIAHDPSGTL